MSTLSIIYETKYGQTQKIAQHIADLARERGHTVEMKTVDEADARPLPASAAYVLLAPVYMGKHPRASREFVVRHGGFLDTKPGAFVSVSGAAGSARPRDREEARQRAVELLAASAWRPSLISTIGGAIAYPRYGFFTRLMMKMTAKREGVSTDASRTQELTDWAAVDQLMLELLALIEKRSAATTAAPPAIA